jgi:outer membrane protein assembly factor BamB
LKHPTHAKFHRFFPLALLAALSLSADPDFDDLVRRLGDAEWATREKASDALIDAGDAALPALTGALESADPEVRLRAREAIQAIEAGLDSAAYREFGDVTRDYASLDQNQRLALRNAMIDRLKKRAGRSLARLASLENDEADRFAIYGEALRMDPEHVVPSMERALAAEPDRIAAAALVGHYRRLSRIPDATRVADALPASAPHLPVALAYDLAELRAAAGDWPKAAAAYAALEKRPPAPAEADAAGDRLAFLSLAGDHAAASAATDELLKSTEDAQAAGFTRAFRRLAEHGDLALAVRVALRGLEGAAGGPIALGAARVLVAAGREPEALLCFRAAVQAAGTDESVASGAVDAMVEAYAAAGRTSLASRELAREIAAPGPAASRHAGAGRLFAAAGLQEISSAEWKKAWVLAPENRDAAIEAARASIAAGDPSARSWIAAALAAAGGAESAYARLSAPLPRGRSPLPIARPAVVFAQESGDMRYATCGDVAVVTDAGSKKVIAFDEAGKTRWQWTWERADEVSLLHDGAVERRRLTMLEAVWARGADAFLVAVAEIESVSTQQDGNSQYGGAWLVTLDAATGKERSAVRHPGSHMVSGRPVVVSERIAVVADEDMSSLVGIDLESGRTAWVRTIDRNTAAADPTAWRIQPRLALAGDLVLAPSPHGSRLRAFRVADGAPAWDLPTPGPCVDVLLRDGIAFAAAGRNAVAADPATGRLLWTRETRGRLLCAPAARDGVVAVRSADGWIYGFDATDGAAKWKCWAGPQHDYEWLEPAGRVFFLLRNASSTWAVAADGRALRRLHIGIRATPCEWKGSLLVDNAILRRLRPFHGPHNTQLEISMPVGLVRLEPDALLADEGAAIARLAGAAPPDAVEAAADAGLAAFDAESPDLLILRARFTAADRRDDAVEDLSRALDALPPHDPRWDAAMDLKNEILGERDPMSLNTGVDTDPWVQESRTENAVARIRRREEDADAALWLGKSGLAGAADLLADRPGGRPAEAYDVAAPIARLRLGDAAALDRVLTIARSGGTAEIAAIEALATRTEPAALAALREALESADVPMRARLAAALALGASGGALALDLIEKFGLSEDKDRELYLRSASILLKEGRARAIASLARDNQPELGAGLLPCPYAMLATSGNSDAVAKLETAATTRHARTYQAAWYFLRHHPDRAHRAIAKAWEAKALDGEGPLASVVTLLSPAEHPEVATLVTKVVPPLLTGESSVEESQLSMRIQLFDALDVLGRVKEARRHVDFYTSLFTDNASMNNNGAWYLSIAKSRALRNGPKAAEMAARAVEAEPESASYWDTWAEALRECGRYDAAVVAARRAWELAPADGSNCDAPYCARQLARMQALQASNGLSDGAPAK